MVYPIQINIKFTSTSDAPFTRRVRVEGEVTIYAEKTARKEEIMEKISRILDIVKEVIE